MKNLFYSEADKMLFYITGYVDGINVKDQISMLQNNYNYMVKISAVKEVYSYEIRKSSRYKYMRVFYVYTDYPPSDAFKLGNDWTMYKWIEN